MPVVQALVACIAAIAQILGCQVAELGSVVLQGSQMPRARPRRR